MSSYILIETPPFPFFVHAGDATYRPGDMHKKRTHLNCFDVLIVESGCLYMTVNGKNYEVRDNEILILPPNIEHKGYKRCSERTYFHWLHFYTTENYELTDTIHKEFQPLRFFDYSKIKSEQIILPLFQKIKEDQAPNIYSTLSRLETLSVNQYNHASMVNKDTLIMQNPIYLQQQFLKFFSQIIWQRERTIKNSTSVSIVINYLDANYSQKISLEDMAKLANCHPTHLIRCFKDVCGTTPVKYLTAIRIQKAQELLTRTSFSCEKIAEQTGFCSAAYFSKVFKETVGISPEQFRNQKN